MDYSLANYCFIIVHNKPYLKTINIQTGFDEIWYIVKYFIVNIFSFLIVFDLTKPKTGIIFIHHYRTVQNHRQRPFSSSPAHARLHCTMCNNKSSVPEFTR